MAMKSRVRVLGLLAVGVACGCGGTATRGDSDSSDTDASGSSDGFGGDSSDGAGGSVGGSGGSSASDSDGSADSTVNAGGAATTRGTDSGTATTRGGTTRGDTTRGDSTTSGDTTSGDTTSGDTTSAQSITATSAGSSNTGSAVSSGAGGMVGTSDSGGTTANTTVSTSGNGGAGGDPSSSNTATFTTSSVVTSTTGAEPDPDLEDFPYLDGCADNYWNVGTDYCNLSFSCSGDYGYSSCWNNGNGEFSCDCSRDYYYSTYWLSETDAQSACAYATSACIAGPDAERGQPKCTPSYLYQGATYCSANAACQTSVDIEGADIAKTSNNSVNCEQREDSWVCNCYTEEGQLTVTLSSEDGSAGMCVDALDWCGGEITREGPRDCRPSSQNAQTNSCYANLLCTQDVLVGGAPATLSESFTVNCENEESGAWACNCPGAGSIEVAAETAWDACTLAASECTPE